MQTYLRGVSVNNLVVTPPTPLMFFLEVKVIKHATAMNCIIVVFVLTQVLERREVHSYIYLNSYKNI